MHGTRSISALRPWLEEARAVAVLSGPLVMGNLAWSTIAATDLLLLGQLGSHAVAAATTVVDTAYQLAGTSALYDGSALQRRFRDIHAVTQHVGVSSDFFPLAGGLLVGEEIDAMRI